MKYTAILCGYFSIDESRATELKLDSKWECLTKSTVEKEGYENYYYPEFVNFCFGDESENSLVRYQQKINQTITISREVKGAECKYDLLIDNITIYVAPHNILMYSIRIEKDCKDPNDATSIVHMLRNVCRYDEFNITSFIELALNPILAIFNDYSNNKLMIDKQSDKPNYSLLVENGNKLKVFQVAEIDCESWNPAKVDTLLFELGTISPIGSYDAKLLESPSQSYFEQIIAENSLSIYNNWKCLSLLDSYTMVYCNCPTWLFNNWIDDYCGMIYITQLYKRYYLFRTNKEYKDKDCDIEKLSNEYMNFERKYCFFKISYNFLPQEINLSMEKGLEIESEKKQLYHMIEQENVRREKRDDNRQNKLLFFLTCIMVISAVWDTCCLLNELYPYQNFWESQVVGFRIVAYSLVFIVLFAIIINKVFKKRK